MDEAFSCQINMNIPVKEEDVEEFSAQEVKLEDQLAAESQVRCCDIVCDVHGNHCVITMIDSIYENFLY